MQVPLSQSSEQDLIAIATIENCTACLWERTQALDPTYVRFPVPAQNLLASATYPPWRTTPDGSRYVGEYEVGREAAAIDVFPEWARKSHLFSDIRFVPTVDYFKTTTIISFYCEACDVRLVKDGNHRLLQCALSHVNPTLTVYEVRSFSWRHSTVDMKNFCSCTISLAGAQT